MTAAQIGVVAFRREVNPASRWSEAQQRREKGRAELKTPRMKREHLWELRALRCFTRRRKGARATAAMATRAKVVRKGPSSGAVIRMKRNDAPQIAERSISLMTSPGLTCSPWNYPVGVLDCVRGGEHPWIPISESRERVPRGGVCKEKFYKRARGATTSY
jgi:hypothetical protein